MKKNKLSLIQRVSYSFRLGGWSKIFIPIIIGQILGAIASGYFDYSLIFAGCVLGCFFLFSIIFTNDLADEKVDMIKRKMFPRDSSPKTLTDNLLPRPFVRALAWGSPCLFIIFSFIFASLYERPYLGIFSFFIILSYSYSCPPFCLNYRFGGEVLEAIGIGVFLPYYNAYMQSSLFWHESYFFFLGFFFWSLAHALCSGICDRTSDILGGKKTFAVNYGNRKTILTILLALFLSIIFWFNLPGLSNLFSKKLLIFFSLTLILSMPFFYSYGNKTIEDNIKEQKKFRKFLHNLTSFMMFFIFYNFYHLLV